MEGVGNTERMDNEAGRDNGCLLIPHRKISVTYGYG
jgi:hypothetical protein